MHRRIVSYILAILIVSQIGGVWVVYTTAIWLHKQNKNARLADQSKWQHFELSPAAFESFRLEEDEVMLNGQLFDIVAIKTTSQGLVITATPDYAENKLVRTLQGFQRENNGWSEFARLAQLFSLTLYETNTQQIEVLEGFETKKRHHAYYITHFSRWVRTKEEQPPAV